MIVTDSYNSDAALTWIAIQEAVREHRLADLAEIAICLYGQLGEAKAEANRLRAALRSCVGVVSMTRPAA
jgi:hypothetical protein